jgi:flagellar biosynthesis/type III secretory pathway M-ring protein FliF/YscJ
MDFLKNQFQRIQQQLSGLTATQKMLTGALVAIMVMTLLYWGRYAGTADMEPLFDQTLSASDLGNVQNRLALKGVKTTTGSGGQILVPSDRKMEILADLAYAKAMPRISDSGFEQMLVKLSPWASATERDAVYNRAKEITTSKLIGYFPDVENAQVVIDPTKTRQIGMAGGGVEPSATITISVRDGVPKAKRREIAEAAAYVVQGAQASLKLERIKVIVNTEAIRLHDNSAPENFAGDPDELFARKLHVEQATETKIADLFGIDGLKVKVSAKINNEIMQKDEEKIDPKTVIVKPVEEETRDTNSGNPNGNSEPGAVPNVGQDSAVANGNLEVGGGAGGGGGTTDHTERSKNVVLPGSKSKTVTRSGPGEVSVVSASIRVPHSWFVTAFKLQSGLPDNQRPDAQALATYVKEESDKFREQLRGVAGMPADAAVYISDYPDILPPPSSIAAVPQTATMSIPVTIGKYGKEIALSGLALVSLFMISMMVKKSAPPPPIPIAATTISVPPPLMVGETVAGEATAGGSMLDGMELDEDAIKTEQMLDQVSTLVKENPDGAAALVKRWLNRD